MIGSEVALAALAIMASIVAALVWLLKKLFTQNDTTLKEGNRANLLLAKSIDKLAVASEEQIKSGRERDSQTLKFQRLVIEKLDSIDTKTALTLDAVANVTIENQHVQNQVVQSETVERKS